MSHRSTFLLGLISSLALACSGNDAPGSVHVLNGFDFPVKVKISTDDGDKKMLKVPANGRVTTSASGIGTILVTTNDGQIVSEDKVSFGNKKKSKGCYRIVNVEGAAAIAKEDVVYGTGFGEANYSLISGWISDEYCYVGWAFEQPPEAISVEQYSPGGRTIAWLHLVGDGRWNTAVDALLSETEFPSQARGRAQRIVQTVFHYDPNNPAMAAIEKRFAEEGLLFPNAENEKERIAREKKNEERKKARELRNKNKG